MKIIEHWTTLNLRGEAGSIMLTLIIMYLFLRQISSAPQVLHSSSQTFRTFPANVCGTNSKYSSRTSSYIKLPSCVDIVTLYFDQPLYIHSPFMNSSDKSLNPVFLSGIDVQQMIDNKGIIFHGNSARCLSWRSFDYDLQDQKNHDYTEDSDIDALLHQIYNNHAQPNTLRFIQRSPCLDIQSNRKSGKIQCAISIINNTMIGSYNKIDNDNIVDDDASYLVLTRQTFNILENIENIYSYKIDLDTAEEAISMNISSLNTSVGNAEYNQNQANRISDTIFWKGSCKDDEHTFSAENIKINDIRNLTKLSLLETTDRSTIMTRMFKGLVTDVVDGAVGGSMENFLEGTEERGGDALSDDLQTKTETSVDGEAPIKISELLEASLTYNLTGLLTDSVTAALSPRLSSAVFDNVGSVIARAVGDRIPNLVSNNIASLLLATIGERLDSSLPQLLHRSLTPNLINILTRSVTH